MLKSVRTDASAIDLAVIAPCYNEEGNVRALVERVLHVFDKRGLSGQIILINDASRDRTGELIDSLADSDERVVAIHHSTNLGIEGGWRSGVSRAEGRYICLIDADLQNPPEEIWRLYREIVDSRADVVQGTRSSIGRLKDSRWLYSKGLNVLLNILFGMSAQDNKSGFVIAHKETMQEILQHRFHYNYFQTFITVAAKSKGFSIREVETLFLSRNAGQSFIQGLALILILNLIVDLVKAVVEYRLSTRPADEILERFLDTAKPTRNARPYNGWRKVLMETYFATMPLHSWLITGRIKRVFQLLRQSQWLSCNDTRKLQELKLRRLLRHVYNHVPYYRHAMDIAKLKPADISTVDDLAKFPLLSKNDVRENLYFDLFSDNHRKPDMLKIATSGSTGEPFVTYADRRQLELRFATTLRAAEWTGWSFGDRQARLWHQTLGMTWLQVLRERVDALLMRRLFIPAWEMRDDNIGKAIDKIRRYKPVLVDGYAESFNFLAYYAAKSRIEGFQPKAIMTSAQIMPDQVRAAIQSQFGAEVFDKYGSREFSGIAYECDHHEGHHVQAESYIVEILKDGRPASPGEVGEIVITDLNNFAVPLIRYRIGDLATVIDPNEQCSCGRGAPRIGKIEGRSQAIILGANGAWLPGTYFSHLIKDYDFAIKQFQVIQNERGKIILRIVKEMQYTDAVLNEILGEFKKVLGGDIRIDVQQVDEIPLGRTGKRTSVVSNLGLDFQKLADETGAVAAETELRPSIVACRGMIREDR